MDGKLLDTLWIKEAKTHVGLSEIKGASHNPTILKWIKELGGWFKDDETPWCGTFVAHCLQVAGRPIPKHWYRALDYLNYGTKLDKPAVGSIGVMGRTGGGHVCFIVGKTAKGDLVCLGGNQNNKVSYVNYPQWRFKAFVWPDAAPNKPSRPLSGRYDLKVMSLNGVETPISEA